MPGRPGSGGPVPKRSDQRRRRNVPAVPVDKAPSGIAAPESAPPADERWLPETTELYESFARSGQAAFYEPSDWQLLRFGCRLVDGLYRSGKPSGQMVVAVLGLFSSLLATEGDRRRLRLELTRETPAEPASVAILAKYRSAASGAE